MPRMGPELVQTLTRGQQWQMRMLHTPCKAPGWFCYGAWCPWCFTYQQRNQVLQMTGEPYVCCGGICPCGPLGEPQSEGMKPWLLCLEVCCCPMLAVAGNRYALQTRLWRQNDPCDDCVLALQVCLSCCALLLAIAGTDEEDARRCQDFADLTNCAVVACMLAQQQAKRARL